MVNKQLDDYEIDRLTVNLMQTNRLRWLVDDLCKELMCYYTRELDCETTRKVKRYLNYVERMRGEIDDIFLSAKADIVNKLKQTS